MTPYDHALKFYGAIDWYRTLDEYVRRHFVYASPTALCLAKPLMLYDGKDDTWWIEWASGDLEEMVNHLPFWLPYVGFSVKGRVRTYATATFINRLLRHDSVKDGPSDPLLRRGRERPETTQTASSAITYICGGEFGKNEDPGQAA